jgi:hypothetical protein
MSELQHIPSKKCQKILKEFYRAADMSKWLQNFIYSLNNGIQFFPQSSSSATLAASHSALLLMFLSARTMVWALSTKIL